MNKNIITRNAELQLCNMRAVDDETRLIEGYAVVFNKRSHLLWDYNSYNRKRCSNVTTFWYF